MGLVTWLRSKLSLRKNSSEESTIQLLRKEIEKLKEENVALKEKIIVLPEKNNEKIIVTFFDENIEEIIIKNIRETKEEICIAVAWFTSEILMDELRDLKRRGINIKVIISEAKENNKSIYKLIDVCNKLKTVVIPKRGNKSYSNLMHNKYCIIDNKKVIDGSYNWSKNAKYNLEHVIVIKSRTVAKMYKNSFEKIYNNPEYYSDYEIYDKLG
ncbi:phospholipase D-like domain-containing protein [Clostridium lundense]|uniref:phospholipase D-like domain-containing protein n=1 Tax=Clostridium lundense TaxID=319475 RepID=UPI0006888401|nr:phospholipase D-like domain-containing protein [Clostridium lundense]